MASKILENDLLNKGVLGMADKPGLSAKDMQYKFEEIQREIIIPKLNEVIGEVGSMLSPFDNEKTYAVGEYCIYKDELYKCIDAVTIPGTWNDKKWGVTTLSDALKDLQSQVDNAIKESANAVAEEAAARKAEIAIERARIDSIAKLPEGSTTGDAELIDGRVDYKGNTHTNIGEHIREVSSQLSEEIEDSAVNGYECLIYKRNNEINSSLSYESVEQVFEFDGVNYPTNGKKYATLKSTNVHTSIGSIYLRLNELDSEDNVIVRNAVSKESAVIELNENTVKLKLCYVINYSITKNSAVAYGSELINLYLWSDIPSSKVEGVTELGNSVKEWNNEFTEIKNVSYKYGYIDYDGIPRWDYGSWYMTSGIIPIIEGETKVILSKLLASDSISTIAFFNSFNVSKNNCIEYHVKPTSNVFDIPKKAVCYVTTVNPNYADCVIMTQRVKLADETRKDKIPTNDMMYCDTDGTIRSIYNPYKNGGELQLSGQMHAHTWQSNGTQPFTAQELLKVHASCGYDFMTITDYADYGITKADTTDEVLFLFGSYEARCNPYSADADNGQHIIVWNANEVAKFPDYTHPQIMLDFANSDNKVASYAHPMSPKLLQSDDKINSIVNCRFIEVYNGLTHLMGDISNEDNERAWNLLLSGGNFTLGMGVSDTHTTTESYVRQGCIKVFCNEKTRECIWKNILDGNFYICSNVDANINSISLSNDIITIDIGQNNTTEWLDEKGNVLNTTTDNISTYKIVGSEKCVRARIHLADLDYYVWTQPMFL